MNSQGKNLELFVELSLNDASPQEPLIPVEYAKQRSVAADKMKPLEERLEALEDVYESEVGDTMLSRARNLEREIGIRQLYIKFEGSNPSGTHKDRIAFVQVIDALRRGYDTVTLATCGNYGVAMAAACSLAGIKCLVFYPEQYHTRRLNEMVALGAEIIRIPGDYERAVDMSREAAVKDELYDANPGGSNTAMQLRAYGEIAHEIYDELRDAPAAVALPVSNGTTIAGIHRGFLSLYRRGKTSRMPRLIAGSSFNKNPIVWAFTKNTARCADLKPELIKETPINEPLINWHSIDGDLALGAIRSTGGWAANVSDKSLLTFSRLLREREGINVLPASTAGIVAFADGHRRQPLPNDRYVIILTGRR